MLAPQEGEAPLRLRPAPSPGEKEQNGALGSAPPPTCCVPRARSQQPVTGQEGQPGEGASPADRHSGTWRGGDLGPNVFPWSHVSVGAGLAAGWGEGGAQDTEFEDAAPRAPPPPGPRAAVLKGEVCPLEAAVVTSRCVVFDCHDGLRALQVWAGALPHPTHLRPAQFSNVLSDIQVSTNPDQNTLNLDSKCHFPCHGRTIPCALYRVNQGTPVFHQNSLSCLAVWRNWVTAAALHLVHERSRLLT